jgi:glycosyltransferase involved in cell wall biosynthesis
VKRVAFNAVLMHPQAGGIEIYMKNLIAGLLQATTEWEKLIILRQEAMKDYGWHASSIFMPVHVPVNNPFRRLASETVVLKRFLSEHPVDLFHAPTSYALPVVNVSTIVTIHDLRYSHFPETYGRLRGAFLGRIIPWSLRKALHIIAISEYTKQDVVSLFGIPPEKVTIVHSGVETGRFAAKFSDHEKERVRRKYCLPQSYILAVGHLEPRKNYERLFEAYDQLRKRHHVRQSLVIVGQENWYFQRIYQRVKQLHLSDSIHFTGFVDPADLPLIYQMASLFVAPSIFEGFGFTPLEAMAAGVPVAAANATSHPEVCGNAAAYFDPFDVEDMAEKMLMLIEDHQSSQALVEEGRRNILRFSWEKCCRETFQVYDECLQEL